MTMSALATDVMLPAFPTMARDFAVSEAVIQQVISVFMIGYALPHLVIGSLADHFGRRPVLLTGLAIYFLGSLISLLAPSLTVLLVGRFVQGFGAAAGPILSRAVLRDLYQGRELGRMLSYAMIFFTAAPLLAPAVGALMLKIGHWQLIFVFLLLVAVVLTLLVVLVLPETMTKPDSRALSPKNILTNARAVFTNPRSAWAVVMMAFIYAGLMAYLLSAPSIFITHFGLGEGGFALVFALIATTSFVAQPVNARLLRHFEPEQILRYSVPAFLLISVIMVAQFVLGIATLASFVVNLMAFFASFALTIGNGTTLALDPHAHRAGMASGLLGFAQLSIGTLLGTFIGSFAGHGPIALAIGLTVMALLTYPAYRLAVRFRPT